MELRWGFDGTSMDLRRISAFFAVLGRQSHFSGDYWRASVKPVEDETTNVRSYVYASAAGWRDGDTGGGPACGSWGEYPLCDRPREGPRHDCGCGVQVRANGLPLGHYRVPQGRI